MVIGAAVTALAQHFAEGSAPHSGIRVSLHRPVVRRVIDDDDIRAVYEMDKHGIEMRRQAPWVRRGLKREDIGDPSPAVQEERARPMKASVGTQQ